MNHKDQAAFKEACKDWHTKSGGQDLGEYFFKAALSYIRATERLSFEIPTLTDAEIEQIWQFLHDEQGNPPDQHVFARGIAKTLEGKCGAEKY